MAPHGEGSYRSARGPASGARRSGGYSSPTRVGFDSVRSMNGRPLRRCSNTACPRRLGVRLDGMREENTVVLGPWAFVLGPSSVLRPSSVLGLSLVRNALGAARTHRY